MIASSSIAAALPTQRLGEPQDIAEAVLYLIGAAFVTGQTIAVDGGRSVSG